MTALLREFLPPVPAGVAPGKAWTDTTENNDNVPNGSMAVRTITNFQSSSETYEGVKALKIASASSSSFSGNQETGGGSAAIEGTGTGTGVWYVGPDGTYLGGKRSSMQNSDGLGRLRTRTAACGCHPRCDDVAPEMIL